jgi:hypothetical protein
LLALFSVPLAQLLNRQLLIASIVIIILCAALAKDRSILRTAGFVIAYVLALSAVSVVSQNLHTLTGNSRLAVLPGSFAIISPFWAIIVFASTAILLLLLQGQSILPEITVIFLSAWAMSAVVSYVLGLVIVEAVGPVRNQASLLLRLGAVLVLVYVALTFYFASVYQSIQHGDNAAFSFPEKYDPTYLDFAIYSAMITTHGATVFITPSSWFARLLTALHMFGSYVFTTIYLATAIHVIVNRTHGVPNGQ